MSIAMKLGAGFGTVLAIFVGNGVIAMLENRAGLNRVEDVAQLGARSADVSELVEGVSKVRLSMRDFLIESDDTTSAALSKACATFDKQIKDTKEHFKNAERLEMLHELDESFGAYFAGSTELIGHVMQARALRSGALEAAGAALIAELAQMFESEKDAGRRLAIAQAKIDVLEGGLSVNRYFLDRKDQTYTAASTELKRALSEARQLGDSKLPGLIQTYSAAFDQVHDLINRTGTVRSGRLDPAAARVQTVIDHLQASIATTTADTTASARNEAERASNVGIIVLLVSLSLGSAAAVGLSRAISTAVRRISKRAQAIAANDLTGEELPVTSADELGQLTQSVNSMTASLRGIVAELSTAASEVSAASTEIAASSEQISAGLQQQENQVTQIGSAVEEMSGAASDIARKAGEANSEASAAGSAAQTGAQTVGSTVTGMRKIAESVRAAGTSATELGKRGQEIGRIIRSSPTSPIRPTCLHSMPQSKQREPVSMAEALPWSPMKSANSPNAP